MNDRDYLKYAFRSPAPEGISFPASTALRSISLYIVIRNVGN